jgi:hypothetical protein
MPAGIQILNDFGTVQIDDTSPVLALREKVSVPMALTGVSNYYFGSISLSNYINPMVAVRCDQLCYLQSVNFSTNPATVHFRTNVPATVTAYCFDRIGALSGGLGFAVWNAAGQIMFEAASKPAIVVATGANTMNVAVPAGRQHAVCMHSLRLARNYAIDSEPPRRIIETAIAPALQTTASNTLFNPAAAFATLQTISNAPQPANWESRPDAFGIVLDVTGY